MIGAALILFLERNATDFVPLFVLMAKFGVASAFGLVYMTNFIFPVKYAAQTLGFCNLCGRGFTMLSPLLVELPAPIPMVCLVSFLALACFLQLNLKIGSAM